MNYWDKTADDIALYGVHSWFYQLQNVEPHTVGLIEAHVKVVDPTQDGKRPWSRVDVFTMRNPGERVIAYISIGEAENYRQYWDRRWTGVGLDAAKPSWLGAENPAWKGNFKVKFWEKSWQDILFFQLDTILAQGFDGVYLDIIDAYEYWEDRGVAEADHLMVQLVTDIAAHCRRIKPDFWIVPQNGAGLLTDPEYVRVIDAIGREDVLYGEDGDGKVNQVNVRRNNLQQLIPMIEAHKPVLIVEYGLTDEGATSVCQVIRDAGHVPYVTVRDLDKPTEPR